MAAASEPPPLPQCVPSGKYSGQSVEAVWAVDPQYVWFLSQRNLTHVQLLRYKAFFDSCPGAVHRVRELTEGISMPAVTQHQTPNSIFQPGGWRGW
jgi:hypothetical protein